MFIDKVKGLQAKVGSGSYVDLSPYLVEVKYEYPKLYAEGSGRNLAGKMVADLVGIFPKITCEFGPLTKNQLETIIPIIDSPTQTIKYYDPKKQTYVEMDTYPTDYTITNKNVIDGDTTNEGFPISFIAISKRS